MARILITEDSKAITIALTEMLERWGHEAITAENGKEAVDIANSDNPPDIIIMDWMMPIMSGIEACKIIKKSPSPIRPYIIMLTAKTGKDDLIASFEAGADDYLAKPVDAAELKSRVNVAERATENEKQIHKYATEMEELAEERAKQLVHVDRLVTIGTLSSGIVHEINNPLSAINVASQTIDKILTKFIANIDKYIEQNPQDKQILTIIKSEFPALSATTLKSSERITRIVSSLKKFYKKDEHEDPIPYLLTDCINNSLEICKPKIRNIIDIKIDLPESEIWVKVKPEQLDQVLINLIMNAAEEISKTKKSLGKITFKVSDNNKETTTLSITNNGPHIPENILKKIWDAFYTTKKEGTGLGLPISMDIVKNSGGSMRAENLPQGGVCFSITLPQYHNSTN